MRDVTTLDGGHANLNLRIGGDRVLRVFLRDPRSARKERALLERPWRSLRVPDVLDEGDDFLVLEWIELRPLGDDGDGGRAAGAAGAEIHAVRHERPGVLGRGLSPVAPLPDAVAWVRERTEALGGPWRRYREPVLGALADVAEVLEGRRGVVLNHGDFKPSNLFRDPDGRIVVLDWEFAFAGPGLFDVGQLFRWGTTDAFRRGFVDGYARGGGTLPRRWRETAAALDLVNLLGLARPDAAGSRRNADVLARVEDTLAKLRP